MGTFLAPDPSSIVITMLRRIRFYLQEPEGSKYDDDDLLDLVIPPALQEVWNYVNAAADNPIVAAFPLVLVSGKDLYQIPPSVQNVWSINELDATGNIIHEIRPRQRQDYRGNGWMLEGTMIRFTPVPTVDKTYQVYYTPVHDQPMHRAVGELKEGDTVGVDDKFVLSANPALGFLDKRIDGYIGASIRIMGENFVETRVIATYDPHDTSEALPSCTVRPAFDRIGASTNLTYEVIPLGSAAFVEATALGAALKLAAVRSLAASRIKALWDQYRHSRRAEAMRLSAMMGRRGKTMGRLTSDNPDLGLHTLFGSSTAAR